ncbi:hypothetical protein LB526_26740 [Mesorhizobium sp. CA6]|nr:hypothetical protein [Mesorhizobium sp. CA6]MBZ9770355.1 hypothetical protein [Mesorhizobium sp. CA6]
MAADIFAGVLERLRAAAVLSMHSSPPVAEIKRQRELRQRLDSQWQAL